MALTFTFLFEANVSATSRGKAMVASQCTWFNFRGITIKSAMNNYHAKTSFLEDEYMDKLNKYNTILSNNRS